SWSHNCSFEDGYELWRKVGSGSYAIIDSTGANGTAYADSGLAYGQTYTYKVRAFTELNISNYSNEEPIELIILSPSDLTLTALNDQVMQLFWSDNCLFEAGQELWRQVGVGSFAFLDSLNTDVTAYNDSSLTYGETYSYKLRSFTIQNVSAYSDSVSGVTVFPAPSNLSVDALNDHQVELTWDDNCGFEDGYEIQQLKGAGEWEIIDSVQANGSTYTISGLTYGVSYEFKVKAFTDINSSDFSDSVTGSTVFPSPSNLSILQSGDDAVLSWADNSSFETGFSIEKSVEAAPFAEIDTVASDVTTYTDTDIDAISQYRYRVRGFTENNYSDYTDDIEFSLFTGDIYHISPTGSDFTGNGSANYPYKTIQKGIDVAGDSSLILVANGTYNESIDYSGKELTVASYYWLDMDTSHVSATTISAVEGRVVNLDTDGSEFLGFTVTSGDASQGSGIFASDQVTIANCIITGNGYTSTGSGAGIYCVNNSEVTIFTCTITGNSITGDDSDGAGVYCGSNTTVDFIDCTITANTITGDLSHGAGIFAEASSALSLSNCDVNENAIVGESAAGAGVHSVGATLDVSDCDISGNTVTTEFPSGGSVFGTLTFTNCGQTGREGPSQSQVNSAYSGTALEGQVTVSGGIQEWTVPFDGPYTIEVWGAEGGSATSYSSYPGNGARMKGDFELTAGTVLKILVGQEGEDKNYNGGGAGGTFVTTSDNSPLIIAGGGAGAAQSTNYSGANATTSESGQNSSQGYSGGSGGYGGSTHSYGSSGGGGLLGDGADGYSYCSPGLAFINGGAGGDHCNSQAGEGGFGGGGGSDYCSYDASGGGGGYSGGAGCNNAGGGGGSYNAGENQDNSSGVNTGHGQVVI
ncbi:MAG: fibronectin type III domain-containing protein, partial [Gammaproteobacteria bacterium]|nr:fibronectin type III domain-containing protein [Gammaproteobacteria bacterium]